MQLARCNAGPQRDARMNRIRGVVMLLAAVVAIWKGWQIHRGETAFLAYGLGALALVIGIWHLTRPDEAHRRRKQSSTPPSG
jgi:hypothetical protein